MDENNFLAEKFEENRGHLRAVAYRMLGSASEADDAVQETWLRLSQSPADEIENLGGWLTTVVSRVCLDMLRSRKSRREDELNPHGAESPHEGGSDPEKEALLADSVGLALMIVLDKLAPAERVAFVLHDLFAVPFDEIASIVGRTPTATRKLASRARQRVQGAPAVPRTPLAEQRKIATAFLEALRAGDIHALLAVLDPDVIVHVDGAAALSGGPREIHGALEWAKGAVAFAHVARDVHPALVNGSVALAWTPKPGILRVLRFTFGHGKIIGADVVADPARVSQLDVKLLNVWQCAMPGQAPTCSSIEGRMGARCAPRRGIQAAPGGSTYLVSMT